MPEIAWRLEVQRVMGFGKQRQIKRDPYECHLLREIFGNPFRPQPVELAWLDRQDGLLATMATAIYQTNEPSSRCQSWPVLLNWLVTPMKSFFKSLPSTRTACAGCVGRWIWLLGKM